MRSFLFASAAAVSLLAGGAAFAQSVTTPASNIDTGDTRSSIAPRLPSPPVGGDAGPRDYLRTAERALGMHRTGEAQEALERAEARALDRATHQTSAHPTRNPMIEQVSAAREQLGRGDEAGARSSIEKALSMTTAAAAPAPTLAPVGSPSSAAAAAASANGSPVVGADSSGYAGPDGTADAPGNFGQGTIPGTNKPLDDLGPTNTGEGGSSLEQ